MHTEGFRELLVELIQFYEKLSAWETAAARNSGLSPQQNHAIEIIGACGRIRMKPLAEKLGVTTGTLTVMVDRLQRSGYVLRQADPADGRAFNVVLTDAGDEIYRNHHLLHEHLTLDIVGCLDGNEQDLFTELLKRINRTVF